METSIISKLWATHALGKTETMKDDSRTLRGLKRKQFLLAEGEGKVAKLSNSLCPVDPGFVRRGSSQVDPGEDWPGWRSHGEPGLCTMLDDTGMICYTEESSSRMENHHQQIQ